jgi:hypothetical protein
LKPVGAKSLQEPIKQWLGMVVCACYPSYAGKHKQEYYSGLSGRALAWKVWGPEFNPSSVKKKKRQIL